MSPADYAAFISSPFVDERLAGDHRVTAVVVIGASGSIPSPGALPVVVLALGEESGGHGPAAADAVVSAADMPHVLAQIAAAPIAAASLAVLLRAGPPIDVEVGLAAESAVYSMLQDGPEFHAWRATAPHHPDGAEGPAVLIERDGAHLTICLDRPHRHNAISTRMRDDLAAALQLAAVDDTITSVSLRGNGPSFCSGGDLGEFGSRPDPATAHVTRLARSPGRLVHRLGRRLTAYLHGATLGGGIETAAFAHRVVAHPDTVLGLPELALGLIPGAGGTVSLPRRIGRQRTALLALSTEPVNAATAVRWGLVDEIAYDTG
jgi:enoyl-CoA hydratase/carnithine racemase